MSAAAISLFDLFRIGIGPSSSHTVGPMRAAAIFRARLAGVAGVARLTATAYGSLAWTGTGHRTGHALALGLAGYAPETVAPGTPAPTVITLDGRDIPFEIIFDRETLLPRHSNAMRFAAYGADGGPVATLTAYSIGGGFIEVEGDEAAAQDTTPLPYTYTTSAELLTLAARTGLSIAGIARRNEEARHPGSAVDAYITRITETMFACMEHGLAHEGELAGGLHVQRRAGRIYKRLRAEAGQNTSAPHRVMDFVSAFALAVNEENAAGGRVVTAPTNGAAGVVPAVLRYYRDFCPGADTEGEQRFFLTAAAIGGLIKHNASISGAEAGCQGEVGSAAAMAAAGLCAALGGSNAQVENAAEIAMEHHLGMTCDPVRGLVQIPCIERNAFGAIKAIGAASLALHGDGTHVVSLDAVIETMRQTGLDMAAKYKETSQGGLAANVTVC
jgi:L-serine dehydratase